ncbi:MAG: hypothetical protein ACE37F_18710 [Nannocystaceae bacterium]|nr:hypothetical protein [bacterium]
MPGPLRIEHLELALDPEAPFHLNFARAGDEVARALAVAVASSDLQLAVRAAALCGHVTLEGTLEVLRGAARSPRPALREAVAAALERRRDDHPDLLASLLLDPDGRVRARALATLARRPARRRLRHLAALKRLRADPDPRVRSLAHRIGVLRRQAAMCRALQRTM